MDLSGFPRLGNIVEEGRVRKRPIQDCLIFKKFSGNSNFKTIKDSICYFVIRSLSFTTNGAALCCHNTVSFFKDSIIRKIYKISLISSNSKE